MHDGGMLASPANIDDSPRAARRQTYVAAVKRERRVYSLRG